MLIGLSEELDARAQRALAIQKKYRETLLEYFGKVDETGGITFSREDQRSQMHVSQTSLQASGYHADTQLGELCGKSHD